MSATDLRDEPIELDDYPADIFFAYVESRELLRESELFEYARDLPWVQYVLAERKGGGRKPPHALLYLDCVNARYFAGLPWRGERCDPRDERQSALRRERLLALDRREFLVVGLFLDPKADLRVTDAGRLAASTWHVIRLNPFDGIPVVSSADYDFAEPVIQAARLQYVDSCRDNELRSLTNVFNLNFLPDAELGGFTERYR